MIKWLLLILAIFVIFLYLTREYRKTYPTILFFGLKGSGKTTSLVQIALKWLKAGHPVYSSFPIPGCYLIDGRRLGDFQPLPESLILIDEVGILFDNRRWESFSDSTNRFLKYQRQYRATLIAATQVFDEMDKKLRNSFTELWQLHTILGVFVVRRLIRKSIRPTDDNADIVGHYEYAGILNGLKLAYVPRYVGYFKSFDPPTLKDPDVNLLPMSEEQQKCISTKYWLISSLKKSARNLRTFLRTFHGLKKVRKLLDGRRVLRKEKR